MSIESVYIFEMSPVYENEHLKTRARYEYTCTDEDIIDVDLLNLSDDPETWLYKTEDVLMVDYQSSTMCSQKDGVNDANNFDSSNRNFDSRTYTRRKRCSLSPSLESVAEGNSSLLFKMNHNRSSLGVLDINELSTTLGADMLHGILKCTPISETQQEEEDSSSLLKSNDSFNNQKYKKFQLNSTYLTESPFMPRPPSLPAENKRNCLNNNSTLNTTFSIGYHGLSVTSPPKNYSLNLSDSLVTKTTVCDQATLKTEIGDKLSESENEIFNYQNETMIIPSSTPLNERTCVPPVNKFATITKKPRDYNLTFSKSSLSSLRLQSQVSPVNSMLVTSKLNNTFTKSPVNATFCKSTQVINGERESGTEDDQMSSASDSSFSSGTNLPQSVGDLQTIAKQQEESLKQSPQTAPKRNKIIASKDRFNQNQQSTPKRNRGVEVKDVFFNGDDVPSPIMDNTENGGSTSDLSERSSDTRSSSPSHSSHNNNRVLHPISLVTVDRGDQGVLSHGIERTQLPAGRPGPSGVRPPTAMSRLPTARGRGVRPGTTATGIPRPASRLPAPKFRSSTVLQSKPH